MRKKTLFHINPIVLIFVLCLLTSPFCVLIPRAFSLSIEEEKTMGQDFLTQIRKHCEFVNDDFANQFINDLGIYLAKPVQPKHFPFHFYIIKDNTLNAFAAPGGHTFFYSGLIDIMDTIDMLAGVMAHEIGHTAARHLAQRMEQNKKIGLATMAGILAGALIGGKAATALITGSMAAGIQSQLHYSRTDERQADQLGLKFSTSAGFDPSGLTYALNNIEKEHFGTEEIPVYLLTHPNDSERMANLNAMASNYLPGLPKKEVARFRSLFPIFKTVVRAKSLDPLDAKNIFNNELKKDREAFLPNLGLGIVYMRTLQYEQAIRHLKKAHKENPKFSPMMRYLGEAFQMHGENREAILLFENALKTNRYDKSTMFLLGLSYENIEEYEKAIHIFNALTSFDPVKNEVYYHLGISYGRLNRLALAHYNFGLYFKKSGEVQKSKFHFRKASSLAGNNQGLKKKIHKAVKGLE